MRLEEEDNINKGESYMDIAKLEKESLPSLLSKFEECAAVINHSRAIAFKIVDIIHRKGLLQKKSNYSEEQLTFFKEKHGKDDPWNYSTKDVFEAMYSFFSWGQ